MARSYNAGKGSKIALEFKDGHRAYFDYKGRRIRNPTRYELLAWTLKGGK